MMTMMIPTALVTMTINPVTTAPVMLSRIAPTRAAMTVLLVVNRAARSVVVNALIVAIVTVVVAIENERVALTLSAT
jgi:hypothetical protein